MTLLITVFAAIICTIIWYNNAPDDDMKVGILCYLYWGASLLWLVDGIFEYVRLHGAYFTPAMEDMANDLYLGLSAIALGLVAWLVILLVKDPKGVVKASLRKKK